jgi:hypothetical protein
MNQKLRYLFLNWLLISLFGSLAASANNPDKSGDASINPDFWEFESIIDPELDILETIITWNDATEVVDVLIFLSFDGDPFPMPVEFYLEDIDGLTAKLVIPLNNNEEDDLKKSLKRNELKSEGGILNGSVEFDQGNSAPFTLKINDGSWWVEINVIDQVTEWGIGNANVYFQEFDQTFITDEDGWLELPLPQGIHTINIDAFGYLPVEDFVINNVFGEIFNAFDIELVKDPSQALQVVSTTPINGAQDVPLDIVFEVDFNRNIAEGSWGLGFWSIELKNQSSDIHLINQIFIHKDNPSLLIIEPGYPLSGDETFSLVIPSGSVVDAENPFIGTIDDVIITFTTEPDGPAEASITLPDIDTDKIYFEGDYIHIQIFNPEFPPQFEGMTPNISQGIFTDPVTFISQAVIPGAQVSSVNGQSFSITGNVGSVDNTGVIGIQVNDPFGNPLAPPFPIADTYLYDEFSGSDFGLALVGVKIPDGIITSEPDFNQFSNLYNTEQPISFTKAGEGSIEFPEGLNIIDNRESLGALQTNLVISADAESGIFYVELDPASLGFLANNQATIELEGVDFDYFTIFKTEFGSSPDDASDIDPTANLTAKVVDGILTFDVDGFSRYTVLEDLFELLLVASPAEGGSATINTGESPYTAGTIIEIEAEANTGYEFLNWRKNGSPISSDAVYNFTMPNDDVIITAHFIPEGTNVFIVSVDIVPEGTGTTTGQGSYVEGENVEMLAMAAEGFIFDKWVLDDDSEVTDNPYNIEMPDANVNLTANFREIIHAVIDPDSWVFADFPDVDELVTTVTWNDAASVERAYIVINDGEEEFEIDFTFNVTDDDGQTATLTMIPPQDQAKSYSGKNKSEGFMINGYVVFDLGDPAPFTVDITDPTWWLRITVLDMITEFGIEGAVVNIVEADKTLIANEWGEVELSLPAGTYTVNVSSFGYLPVAGFMIDVEGNFDGNRFEIKLDRDPQSFVMVTETSPLNFATEVQVDVTIEIAFERDIREGTMGIGLKDITLNDSSTDSHPIANIIIVDGNTLVIEPELPLAYNTNYMLMIPREAVTDHQNHDIMMQDNFYLTFVTEEEFIPVPAIINPKDVVFYADNPVDIQTTITWNDATEVVSVFEDGDELSLGTDYMVVDNILTIPQQYFAGAIDGEKFEFTINFDAGQALLTVTVL